MLVPVPDVVIEPGDRVRVHVPVAGNPLKTILPIASAHVGCVMVPTIGAVGVVGCVLIATLDVATETHPDALVTV